MRMEDIFKSLGMVNEDGKPFDEEEIRRQVMQSLGVSHPVIETGPAEKPPFRTWESCLQACLSLPVDPYDEAFAQCPKEAAALAVTAVLSLELDDGGIGSFLAHAGSGYALQAAESLRTVGLPDLAGTYEAWLIENQLDAAAIDALEEDAEFSSEPFTEADRDALRRAIAAFAEAHPEVFDD